MSKKHRNPAPRQTPPPQQAASQVPPAPPEVRDSSAPWTSRAIGLAVLAGLALALFLAFLGGGDERPAAVLAVAALAVCAIGKAPFGRLRECLSLPVLLVFFYLLLNAAASLYSSFGSFAAVELGKILAAFGVFGVALLRVKAGQGRRVAQVLSCVTALFALVSIDASSLGLPSRGYFVLMDALGCSYQSMTTGYEAGVRITGIFGNPNVLAGILAFGVFLGLYLVSTATGKKGLLAACLLLEVNTLGFVLAFSMGAMGMFLVSALVYLLAAPRGERLPLLVLMVETALIGVVMAFPAFLGLGAQGGLALVPVLAGPVGGVLLWLLHYYAGNRVGQQLARRPKLAAGAAAGLVTIVLLYVIAALNITGSYQLSPGETLRRSVYPAVGEYTLTGVWSGSVSVVVESQDSVQTIMHTSTVLYQGDLEGAAFTVPEGSRVVYLNLTAPEGGTLEKLTLSDGTGVKLGYKLLPAFAANRLQGLWANQNAIQRTEFFRDGLKIWQRSPVIGNGLGSVEGLVTSVQQFYYESRYVHNHYIQLLSEMGIPGLLTFLALLGSCGVVIFRRRREGKGDPLLAALAACLAMMALHAVVEAVWSISVYQSVALLLLALLCGGYARPLTKAATRLGGRVAMALMWGVTLAFAGLLTGNLMAEGRYAQVQAGTVQQTPYTMTELARMDVYNWAQYKLDMALNACDSEVPEFAQTAAQYARDVRALGIYSADYSLAAYFYPTLGQWEEFFAVTREGILQKASRAESWQEIFSLYEQFFPGEGAENAQWYAGEVLVLYHQLQDFNRGRMEQIVLTEENTAFIQRMQALASKGAA